MPTAFLFIFVTMSLVAGNFIYQAMIGNSLWEVAFERSVFQTVAMATIGLALFLNGKLR